MSQEIEIDLPIDFHMEDETGLPWTFLREARDPDLITEGAWVIAGTPDALAVAQVIDVEDGIVHVRPRRGSVHRWLHLVRRKAESV